MINIYKKKDMYLKDQDIPHDNDIFRSINCQLEIYLFMYVCSVRVIEEYHLLC